MKFIIYLLAILVVESQAMAQDIYPYHYENFNSDKEYKVHYIRYEIVDDTLVLSKCSSKKKCMTGDSYDPFLKETISRDFSRLISYAARDEIFEKNHVFLPNKIKQGEHISEFVSSQGNPAVLSGTFSSKITSIEGDQVHVELRFPHADGGEWDRDLILKKNEKFGWIIVSDSRKVYRRDENRPRAYHRFSLAP